MDHRTLEPKGRASVVNRTAALSKSINGLDVPWPLKSLEDALAETIIDATIDTMTLAELQLMQSGDLDRLPFGVIGLDRSGMTEIYNATEARMAGLAPDSVLGSSFFNAIAQCMNNYLVAQRFEDEAELDDVIPYTLTLRMRPTPVRMRLLSSHAAPLRYILIER